MWLQYVQHVCRKPSTNVSSSAGKGGGQSNFNVGKNKPACSMFTGCASSSGARGPGGEASHKRGEGSLQIECSSVSKYDTRMLHNQDGVFVRYQLRSKQGWRFCKISTFRGSIKTETVYRQVWEHGNTRVNILQGIIFYCCLCHRGNALPWLP